MLFLNPKVAALAVPAHARPVLSAGERLYVPESEIPALALDGTVRDKVSWQDVSDLVASVGLGGWGWDGTNWNAGDAPGGGE